MLLFVAGLLGLAGCGGGGSGSGEDDITLSFDTEMLDSSPTFYVKYPNDLGGTYQGVIAFTGTDGTYSVTFSDYDFGTDNSLTSSEALTLTLTLNGDGSLLVSGEGITDILTLLEETSTFIKVRGENQGDPWEDVWFFSPPEGWITIDEEPISTEFTTELLDPSPTFYVQYPDDLGGTYQGIITFIGTGGTYSITFSDYDFDSNNNQISSASETYNGILQEDGTLSVILDDRTETLTLVSQSSTYIEVRGENQGDPWQDFWQFNPPTGWISVQN